jgi:hypothetical protein
MDAGFQHQHLCGWRSDGGHHAIAKTMPTFRMAANALVNAPGPQSPILLYAAWKHVLGAYPNYPAQEIGDCVSFGHGHGNDLLQCIEIGLGASDVYEETDTEFVYGIARYVAGMLGSKEDGCYGAAAVKAMTTIGEVSREQLGSDGVYSGARAKAWGTDGIPSDMVAKASPYRLGSAALVSTWNELVAALNNGYPVTICTEQGFKLQRDPDGFCKASGTWGHCMLIAGVRFDREGACIIQSWGPDQPAGPTALDQPSFSFWAERDVIERILGEGDSWALSKAPAFKVRELPPAWKYHDMA